MTEPYVWGMRLLPNGAPLCYPHKDFVPALVHAANDGLPGVPLFAVRQYNETTSAFAGTWTPALEDKAVAVKSLVESYKGYFAYGMRKYAGLAWSSAPHHVRVHALVVAWWGRYIRGLAGVEAGDLPEIDTYPCGAEAWGFLTLALAQKATGGESAGAGAGGSGAAST